MTAAIAVEAEPQAAVRLDVRRLARRVLPRVATVVLVLLLWQFAVVVQGPRGLLPAPGDVFSSLQDNLANGHLLTAVTNTLRRAAAGYSVSIVVGTLLGIALARCALLRESIGSLIAALQSLPSVAWVPVAVVLFGINERAVFFVIVLGALPSIANGTVSALMQVPPPLVRAGRAMGAGGVALYRHVYLPAALPGYLAGLSQAWAFSWRSLMAAELIAVGVDLPLGVGSLLEAGRSTSDLALMLMCILVILTIGLVVDGLVFSPIQHGVRRRRGLALD